MSWWISLNDEEGEYLYSEEVIAEGGTYAIGGTDEMCLNVTYNYSQHYYKHVNEENGIRWLDGKTGEETAEVLEKAIEALGDDVDDNYWNATEGNAKKALTTLLRWAKERPDGIWRVN